MPRFVTQRSLYEVRERPSKAYSWAASLIANVFSGNSVSDTAGHSRICLVLLSDLWQASVIRPPKAYTAIMYTVFRVCQCKTL